MFMNSICNTFMQPLVLLLEGQKPPVSLSALGVSSQLFNVENLRELNSTTAHWVCLIPASLLGLPEWNRLRVRLTQLNRYFIVHGEPHPSSMIVQALRDGAFDFVYHSDPVERWSQALDKAAESQRIWLQLYESPGSAETLLVGKSAAIQTLIQSIKRIGPTQANVLISGESGTGKEKVALALHQASGLSGPFLPVNCAAIPRDLIEAELFGAEKGSYTGALQARQGLVEQAGGGTLFLDEIGELDISLQPKLLRFLESRRARRVGGKTEYAVDARILAATNRDLELQIDRNQFRADLFYRLSEISMKLAPLRNHMEDVPLLAWHFLNEANERFGKNFASLDPDLVASLMAYSWPGNARELRAAIHRMAILQDGPVLRGTWKEPSARLPEAELRPVLAGAVAGNRPLNKREKWERAREYLKESGNDLTWTAAQMGIHPSTLFRWMKSGKV